MMYPNECKLMYVNDASEYVNDVSFRYIIYIHLSYMCVNEISERMQTYVCKWCIWMNANFCPGGVCIRNLRACIYVCMCVCMNICIHAQIPTYIYSDTNIHLLFMYADNVRVILNASIDALFVQMDICIRTVTCIHLFRYIHTYTYYSCMQTMSGSF
jgi:hypothetical protein